MYVRDVITDANDLPASGCTFGYWKAIPARALDVELESGLTKVTHSGLTNDEAPVTPQDLSKLAYTHSAMRARRVSLLFLQTGRRCTGSS